MDMPQMSLVDAPIIDAPSSTKNAEKQRDPEMHQTKKGGQWRFGMKCHICADAGSRLVYAVEVTAANEYGITAASKLIREDDEVVYGDSGYLGFKNGKRYRLTPIWRPLTIVLTAALRAFREYPFGLLTGSGT